MSSVVTLEAKSFQELTSAIAHWQAQLIKERNTLEIKSISHAFSPAVPFECTAIIVFELRP